MHETVGRNCGVAVSCWNRTKLLHTVLTLKFVYYLDGKRATLASVLADISTLAYDIARSG
jgi:hypothetical protein